MGLPEEILLAALSWYFTEAMTVEIKIVGEEQGFEYDTLAVVDNDSTYFELSENEIRYRAELMEN